MREQDVAAPVTFAPYTTADVADAAGITPRTLDWWRTVGLVRPTVEPKRRGVSARWTGGELRYVMALSYLHSAGIELASLRQNPTEDGVRRLCEQLGRAIDDALGLLDIPANVIPADNPPSR